MRNVQENIIKTNTNRNVNFVPGRAVAVTPHDTNTFAYGLLFVGVGGNVKALPVDNDDFVTFKGVLDGSFLPIYIKAVHTDTTATDMLICY